MKWRGLYNWKIKTASKQVIVMVLIKICSAFIGFNKPLNVVRNQVPISQNKKS